LKLDEALRHAIEERLFSSASPTFRIGQIGGWRNHFDADLREMFKEAAGDVLIKYGYETDNRW